MSLFSDLLTVYAKRAGANSPQIASFCGMDRVTVYRFMKGKTLPKDKETVSRMAEFLQLTRDESRTLEEAYDYSRLGAHAYWQRKYIQSFMRSFSGKARTLIPSLQYDTEEVEELPAETRIVSGTDSVIRRIQKEILAEREKTVGRIELVMRPGTGPVMDMLLSAGRKNRALQVKHLIPVTNTSLSKAHELNSALGGLFHVTANSPSVEEGRLCSFPRIANISAGPDALRSGAGEGGGEWASQEQGWNQDLLQYFFQVVSLCAAGFDYMPSYFYTQYAEIGQFPVYSNLLLSGSAAILFTDDLEEALCFQAPDQVRFFRKKFEKFAEGMPVFARIFRDIESFLFSMNQTFLDRDRKPEERDLYYTALPCILPVLTDDILEKYIRKEALRTGEDDGSSGLRSCFAYVNAIRALYSAGEVNQMDYFSASGVRAFLETGRVAEIPPELYDPIGPEDRKQILRMLADHPHYRFQMLKKELSAPEGMLCVEVMERLLFLEFLVPGKGTCFLYINEPSVLTAFRGFFRDLSKEDLYSEEESREILRRMAEET